MHSQIKKHFSVVRRKHCVKKERLEMFLGKAQIRPLVVINAQQENLVLKTGKPRKRRHAETPVLQANMYCLQQVLPMQLVSIAKLVDMEIWRDRHQKQRDALQHVQVGNMAQSLEKQLNQMRVNTIALKGIIAQVQIKTFNALPGVLET